MDFAKLNKYLLPIFGMLFPIYVLKNWLMFERAKIFCKEGSCFVDVAKSTDFYLYWSLVFFVFVMFLFALFYSYLVFSGKFDKLKSSK